jgi:hypothetical protein
MRERREAAGFDDDCCDALDRRAASRDERRPPVPQESIEGISSIDRVAGRYECIGDHWPAHALPIAARGAFEHRLEVDVATECAEPRRDLPDPVHTIGPLRPQESRKRLVGWIDEVSEDVHVAAAFDGRDLDPIDQPQTMRNGRLTRFGQAGNGIVIGDSQHA